MEFVSVIFQNHWKLIASTFTISKFLWDFYLHNRQLKKVEQTEVQFSTEQTDLVVNDKSSQALSNLKDLLRLHTDKLGFDLIRNLIIINFNVYHKIWTVSGTINELLSFILPINSVSQTVLFSVVSNGLLFSWGIPIQFYSEYFVSKFPKQEPPLKWLVYNFSKFVLKCIGDSFKIFGFLMLAKFAKSFPIWQISLGFLVYTIVKVSLTPLFVKIVFPGYLKPLPKGELKDELTKVCAEVGYDPESIYLSDFFGGIGYNYLPNCVLANERLIDKFTTKEYSSKVLSVIFTITLNANLNQKLRETAELYVNLLFFDYFFINDNTILTQFGFTGNQDDLIFIKYLIFNQIFLPFNLVIKSLQKYIDRLHNQQLDEETYEIYKQIFINSLKKTQNNNDLLVFESDYLYNIYYTNLPDIGRRIKYLEQLDKVEKID
ncbi:hypothetical protein KGF54_001485 [Candida jiufengensis]|uniref:uncharacterized protein n=1 Tax=Candida jiufengensis TaxID=497108 RepID=UPI0022252FB5|nr:uncharacterized protein KGF54_001485 [Candida jiufengensis]KAI5954924.1 hypothetical protein KGF54_001485 [Candida jiufengensis]